MEEDEVKTDDGSPKIKPRPIVQLGIFLISHSPVFRLTCFRHHFASQCLLVSMFWLRWWCYSVVFSAAGVMALLLLPLLAKNTYISENALMPGLNECLIISCFCFLMTVDENKEWYLWLIETLWVLTKFSSTLLNDVSLWLFQFKRSVVWWFTFFLNVFFRLCTVHALSSGCFRWKQTG